MDMILNSITPGLMLVVLALVVFLLYWAFNFTILYHLTRFGVGTLPKKLAAVFLLGSIVIFFVVSSLFAGLDTDFLRAKLSAFAWNATGNIYAR